VGAARKGERKRGGKPTYTAKAKTVSALFEKKHMQRLGDEKQVQRGGEPAAGPVADKPEYWNGCRGFGRIQKKGVPRENECVKNSVTMPEGQDREVQDYGGPYVWGKARRGDHQRGNTGGEKICWAGGPL